MRRDLDLIARIIEFMSGQPLKGKVPLRDIEISGYSDDEVEYHVRLAVKAKLLEREENPGGALYVTGITWEGHEFLDSHLAAG